MAEYYKSMLGDTSFSFWYFLIYMQKECNQNTVTKIKKNYPEML